MEVSNINSYAGQLLSLKYVLGLAADLNVAMVQHYVTRTIANDTGMLKDTTDQRVLFSHFERIYSIHDAEDGFPWAARFIKFGDSNQKGSKTTPGPFWIKCTLLIAWRLDPYWYRDSFLCQSCSENKTPPWQATQRRTRSSKSSWFLRPVSYLQGVWQNKTQTFPTKACAASAKVATKETPCARDHGFWTVKWGDGYG